MIEKFKKLITEKSLSEKMAGIAAIIALIAALAEIIYGAIYAQYADFSIVLFLLGAAAAWIAYFIVKDHPVLNWLCVLGVIFAAVSLSLFISNSYNVWADTWGCISQEGVLFGSFNFFNSEGGPVRALIIILLVLGSCVCGSISCFKSKEKTLDKVDLRVQEI